MPFRTLHGGRKPPWPDFVKPRLWIDDFAPPGLRAGAAPPAVAYPDWGTRVTEAGLWQMDLNNQLSTCGIAGMDNLQIALSVYGNTQFPAPWGDDITLQLYETLGGYKPGDPSTDQGTVLQDNLAYWRHNPIGGTEILGFGALRPGSWFRAERQYAMSAFGPLYGGYTLPESAEQQFSASAPFTFVPGSAVAGGHCMVEVAELNSLDSPKPVTWSREWSMTRQFLMATMDECWVAITAQGIEANGTNQYGWDTAGMNEALASLTGETNPLKLKTIL